MYTLYPLYSIDYIYKLFTPVVHPNCPIIVCVYIFVGQIMKNIDTQVVLVLPYQVEVLFLGKCGSRFQQDSNA